MNAVNRTQQRPRPRPRPQTESIPPTPEDLFERWLDDVIPILRETWIAGYERASYDGTTSSSMRSTSNSSLRRQKSDDEEYQDLKDRLAEQEGTPEGLLWEMPNDELPPGWRKVYHTRGEQPCRNAALLVTRAVVYGEKADPIDVLRKVNGRKVSDDEVPECGYCGYQLEEPASNNDLDWEPHLVYPRRNVRFADNPDETGLHPIDALHRLQENLHDPYTGDQDERFDGPQPLMLDDEEEALRRLGQELHVYAPNQNDDEETHHAEGETSEHRPEYSSTISGRNNGSEEARHPAPPRRGYTPPSSSVSRKRRKAKARKR